MSVEVIETEQGFFSKSHPHRAVAECLFGWACYQAPEGATGRVEGERVGIVGTLTEAEDWLSGGNPKMFKVLSRD